MQIQGTNLQLLRICSFIFIYHRNGQVLVTCTCTIIVSRSRRAPVFLEYTHPTQTDIYTTHTRAIVLYTLTTEYTVIRTIGSICSSAWAIRIRYWRYSVRTLLWLGPCLVLIYQISCTITSSYSVTYQGLAQYSLNKLFMY